jgi:hypothetical protein
MIYRINSHLRIPRNISRFMFARLRIWRVRIKIQYHVRNALINSLQSTLISHEKIEYIFSTYEDKERCAQNESTASEGFIMIVNNYYTPKIFDLNNSDQKTINI